MMLSAAASSSRNFRHVGRRFVIVPRQRSCLLHNGAAANRNDATTAAACSSPQPFARGSILSATGGALLVLAAASMVAVTVHPQRTSLDAPNRVRRASSRQAAGDVLMVGAPVKEKATGILFPQLCNGYSLVGCGVRVKWGLIKVYAVGTYVDPLAMTAIKTQPPETIEAALLNPMYPRTIRLVMNRGLSIDKYTSAIVEALEPRMKGEDLEALEEFKLLNPPVDLVEGAEIEMTIRGDTLLYRNAVGGVGAIHSAVFTRALCEVYYGADPVSPTHKQAVLEGIPKLA